MNLTKFSKILIIRLSSLGDVLLTTPLLRTLKSLYPHLQIDYIVRKEYESTLLFNPHISNLITIERDYDALKLRSKISENKYDLIIDLQNNLRSRRIIRKNSSEIVRYKKPYLNRILLVKLKINRFKEILSIPVRYANSIKELVLDEKGLELFISPKSHSTLNEGNYIGFCPGSRHITKMWPKEYFVELGNKLVSMGYKIVLFGGKDDMDLCKEISNKIQNSVNLSNNNDLLELAVNMKMCNAIICNDSGLMHTALAVSVPVAAIFGSTVKEFGFYPYRGENIVLENNSLSCRPCSHIGLNNCPKNHLDCLNKITPDSVLEETIKLIKKI